jgi:hypothetical protein
MDPCDDEIGRLLRLKRYEQPPPAYFENFLHEFRRRQRDELLRQPIRHFSFERPEGVAFGFNIRRLASVGIVVVIACCGVISVRLYQRPDATQLAIQGSAVPSRPSDAENVLDVGPPVFMQALDRQPILLPGSRQVRLLPGDSLRSDQRVPLKLEWESFDRQSLLEK